MRGETRGAPRRPILTDRAVFLITGPSGAGKSTVARLLAGQFLRGVHLEGDFFRRSIVSGRSQVTPDRPPEALSQLRLRYRVSALAAYTYFREGYAVVMEDLVAGDMLAECAALVRSRPLHVVVLLPRVEVVAARDAGRLGTGYGRWPLEALYALFEQDTPRLGVWLDISEQTPEETVQSILASRESALIAP